MHYIASAPSIGTDLTILITQILYTTICKLFKRYYVPQGENLSVKIIIYLLCLYIFFTPTIHKYYFSGIGDNELLGHLMTISGYRYPWTQTQKSQVGVHMRLHACDTCVFLK